MNTWGAALRNSLFSGGVAGVAVTATAALLGQIHGRGTLLAVGAPSHVLWGDEAGTAEYQSPRTVVPGLLINHAAAGFWALIYEKLVGANPAPGKAALTGGAVAALAYITDYKVVPKRLTPGYELALPPQALYGIFAVMGLSLALSTVVRERSGR